MHTRIKEARPGVILAIIVASYLMIGVDMTIVNIALPSLKEMLHFSTVSLSWVVDSYMITYGGLLFLGGRTGDIIGRKRTLLAGLAIFTLASAGAGLAVSPAWLLAARVLQGVGAALVSPSTLALLISNFPEGAPRNQALSVYSASISLGAIVGLLLGGLLTSWISWRWVFFINLPVGLALMAAIPVLLGETERTEGAFDVMGAIAATIGVISLVFALIRAATTGFGDPEALATFALAAALLSFFVVHEKHTAQPLLPMHLFGDRNRVGAYLNFLFVLAGNFGTFFFATQFLQGVLGLTPFQTGLAFLPMALTLLVTVRLLPRLLKRISARAAIIPGTFIQGLGILWLSRFSATSDYLHALFGPMVLIGLASGLCVMPLNTIALSGVERRESGAASGLAQTMLSVGGSLGLAVLVTIFGSVGHGSHALFIHAARTSLSTAAMFSAAAFLVSLFIIRSPRAEQAQHDPERNKSVVRRYLEMWNTGDTAAVREILHPQWVDHAHPEIRGVEEVAAALERTRSESPDLHIGIESMISEGDRVAVHSTIRTTHQGGTRLSRDIWLIRLEEDRLAEMWTASEQGPTGPSSTSGFEAAVEV